MLNPTSNAFTLQEGARMSATSLFDRLNTSAWNVTLLGESYLYPFDASVPRNCETLRVPPDYCICQNRAKVRAKGPNTIFTLKCSESQGLLRKCVMII